MFKKLKIKLSEGKLRQLQFLGIPVFSYGNIRGKKFKYFFNYRNTFTQQNKPVFYLKVNRDIMDSILCLQYWIDTAHEFGVDFYILCDNEPLKRRILKNIYFYSPDIKFLKTKKSIFKNILKLQRIAPNWKNAACAHLQTFEHAKSLGLKHYWNIDADDTLFLTNVTNTVKVLNDAQIYAEENDIDLFSFDFWATKTKNHHWSFGITYQRSTKNYLQLLENHLIDWNNYKNWTSVYNIDWVFTFLKNSKKINAKTFYVNNLYFIHFGRFFSDLKNANIAYWSNNKMVWPIWADIFKDSRGVFDIPQTEDIVKLEFESNKEECLDFGIKYLVNLDRIPLNKKDDVNENF